MRLISLLAVLLLTLNPKLFAQVSQGWAQSIPSHYGKMIALDSANNAFVAGSDPLAHTIVTAKYGPAGNQLWQRVFDNPGTSELGSWVTVDKDGNAIVTGYHVRASNNDPTGLIVLKYDANGNLLWQDLIPNAFGFALRADTDATGSIYVLGRLFATNASGNTTHDIALIKYAPNGSKLWTRTFGFDAFSADSPTSQAIAPNGNVIVTGGATGWFLTAAFDPNGNQLWLKTLLGSTGALGIAVAPGGESYVVGGTYSQAQGDAFLVLKYDASGNQVWTRNYAVGYYAIRVAVDSLGDVIATGIGVQKNALDWVTIKINPGGALLWTARYDQHMVNDEIPSAMEVGPDNAIYITGQGGPGPTSGELAYLRTVTLKYSAGGAQEWVESTFASVRGLGVKRGSDNSIYVVGESPWTVYKYIQTGAVNQPPVATATATPASGVAPLNVSFSSAGSFDPNGSIGSYRWNFGDNTAENQNANPAHTYSASGVYVARLTVTDNLGAATIRSVTITVQLALSSLSVFPFSVTGGAGAQGTVTLTGPAPAGGVVVALSSGNSAAAAVPPGVTIAAGATSATFPITTSAVSAFTSVVITGVYQGSASATLTVLPTVTVTNLSLSTTSVRGGNPVYATVFISVAPSPGAVVSLSSSQPRAASVPASVTVNGGGTVATFTIITSKVRRVTQVDITAFIGTSKKVVTLSVTP